MRTHKAARRMNSGAGREGRPSASVAGRNSNAASMLAIDIHAISNAR